MIETLKSVGVAMLLISIPLVLGIFIGSDISVKKIMQRIFK